MKLDISTFHNHLQSIWSNFQSKNVLKVGHPISSGHWLSEASRSPNMEIQPIKNYQSFIITNKTSLSLLYMNCWIREYSESHTLLGLGLFWCRTRVDVWHQNICLHWIMSFSQIIIGVNMLVSCLVFILVISILHICVCIFFVYCSIPTFWHVLLLAGEVLIGMSAIECNYININLRHKPSSQVMGTQCVVNSEVPSLIDKNVITWSLTCVVFVSKKC
jgi:hypothetical protein